MLNVLAVTFALVAFDPANGGEWIIDYNLSKTDCASSRAFFAMLPTFDGWQLTCVDETLMGVDAWPAKRR